jgi:hypothetical protein
MPPARKADKAQDAPPKEEGVLGGPTVEELGGVLLQDMQDSEPQPAIGGAEIAGAQLATHETDHMVASGIPSAPEDAEDEPDED